MSKAEKLYKAASRSRAKRVERKFLEPPKPSSLRRDRAMSDNDLEFMFGSQFSASSPTCSTASLTESPEAIITISEETDDEVFDNLVAKRVASLPDFSEYMPRSLEREVSLEDLAFNDVFFFYVETFVEQEIQTIFKNQSGRGRSYSMAVESSQPMAHS
jgi:hypothetical protein